MMKGLGACIVLVIAAVAWAGHELPIYPSFYPHEIEIKTIAPEQAAGALRDGKLQAYVGPGLSMPGAQPEQIGSIESLGAFVVVRLNPQSPHAKDNACAAVRTVIRALAPEQGGFVPHPYPVTPFHGDYLHHADLADATKARLAEGATDVQGLKIKASGGLARPDWSAHDTDWDAEVIEVDAAGLVASSMLAVNGSIAPPWLKTGWFHAERLLADAVNDPAVKQRAEAAAARLMASDYFGLVDRINLERDLVSALTSTCRTMVAGYTVKREYVNVEFSAGIENIGYDSIDRPALADVHAHREAQGFSLERLASLGTAAAPTAAWNPIGGMTDPFGRLMWSAVSDPALLPSPYEAGWMLNRIADLPTNAGR